LCCHREPRAVGTLLRQPGALSSYRSSFERRCIICAKIQIWVLFVNNFFHSVGRFWVRSGCYFDGLTLTCILQ
jgi:hypothetical protein